MTLKLLLAGLGVILIALPRNVFAEQKTNYVYAGVNATTGGATIPLAFGLMLQTRGGTNKVMPSGNGVSSIFDENINLSGTTPVYTRALPAFQTGFQGGAGNWIPNSTNPLRSLVQNADGTYSLYKTDLGTRDFRIFDYFGRLAGVVQDGVRVLTLSYDSSNRIIGLKDAYGNLVVFSYSGGRLSSISYAGLTFGTQYDASGNLIGFTCSAGNFIALTYASAGHPSSISYLGVGMVIKYFYDSSGRITSVTEAVSGTTMGATYFSYSTGKSVISDGGGDSLTIGYDSQGKITTLSDAYAGKASAFTYGTGNLPVSSAVSVTDCSNQTTTTTTNLTYDAFGDLTGMIQQGVSVYSATFNGFGQMLTQVSSLPNVPAIANQFNQNGQITSGTINGVTTNYTYDQNGFFQSDGNVTYTLDSFGRKLTEVRVGGQYSGTYTHTYFNGTAYNGALSGTTFPDGSVSSTTVSVGANGGFVETVTINTPSLSPIIDTFSYDPWVVPPPAWTGFCDMAAFGQPVPPHYSTEFPNYWVFLSGLLQTPVCNTKTQ